ncbi:DMT family transporter [Aestuariispira ectoiniformans]|uniref:DMT family transporter n=1 Tax=Aestuariispira ectoiniformans TaxID=2775080 RepID=UPI00223C4903|nr:DMT family transporter [Aestuariispira ectoiniformans]
MLIAVLGALGAASCWAIGSLVSVYPAQMLGAAAFNRTRMCIVGLMLIAAASVLGTWASLEQSYFSALILSGLVGIFIGDTALFATLRRMGPRRTAILFAMNAPITTVLGYLFLQERLAPSALAGCALVLGGVVMAIVYGKRKSQLHDWETVRGALPVGIALGLTAATAQAVGLIISKPVLDAGADPVAASAVRVSIAAVALVCANLLPIPQFKAQAPLTKPLLGWIVLSGLLGMGVGMTLLMVALAHGDSGIVATLAATQPVMMLPLIWIRTKECPALGAWLGAIAVVAGTGMIFNA